MNLAVKAKSGGNPRENGAIGLAGRSGGSAGNVLLVTDSLQLNGNTFTISANGGNGSNGQHGGDGYSGKNGNDVEGEPNSGTVYKAGVCSMRELENELSDGGFSFTFYKKINHFECTEYKFRLNAENGEEASNGGDGGKAGCGGTKPFDYSFEDKQ